MSRRGHGCLLAALLACISVCACRSLPDPNVVHDRIFDKIIHGDLQSASADADQAIARFSKQSPAWTWSFKILKAQVLVTQSRGEEALTLLQGDLPPSLAASDDAVRQLLLQGGAYRITQDFQNSRLKLARAEELASSSHPELLSEVLNTRGALEFDQKDYSSAETSFRRALAAARAHKLARQELASRGNLVRVSIVARRFGEAIDQTQSALRLARSSGMASIEAALLGNLGWCYFQLGDFENALDFFKQARDVSERLAITGNSFYWDANVAESHQELHEYAAAQALLRQAIANATKINNKQTMTESLNSLVRLDLITGQLDEAQRNNQQALDIENAGLDHFGVLETRLLEGRVRTLQRNFPSAQTLFQEVMADPTAADSLNWEAVSGLARLYDAQSAEVPADREYRNSIALFESVRASIERDDLRISFLARGIETYEAYIDFLIRHDRSAAALAVADKSRSRTLEEGLKTDVRPSAADAPSFEPRELARRLRSTLLVYWLGERRSYLWIVSPSRITSAVLPSAQEIDPLIKSYREALVVSSDPLASANAEGQKLYSMLIGPAAKFIPANSRVVLLPDGSLYGLNFETLIVPDPKPHYWIEDVTLTTANSLTLLASAASRQPPEEKTLFLVGDAVPPSSEFPALPQAPVEMQAVEKYFPKARRQILSGAQATPAAYLDAPPAQFAYLHFVTHGTASRLQPLESAVVLSTDKNADVFKLYARDIVKHRLSAHLVTISACTGAGSRAYSGEGLVGLSWAFLSAGAHNVIAALWEVSDSSTPQLMDALYDGLSHGQDPATALRSAKLKLLHSNSVYRKPFYWAPFQLYAGS